MVEAELALGLSQLEAMEDEIQGSDQELVRLLNDQEATLEGLMRLEKEAQTWRGQWDEENAHREVLENELNAAKHHFNGEQVALQATCEKLSTHIEDLEQEIRSASDELVQKRRHFVSREAESSTRQAAAEAHLKESQELLASCRDRLREAADQRARSKSEAENQRAKCVEVIGVLERDLENQVQVLLTVRERYEAMLQNEQKVHTQARFLQMCGLTI
ncbi:unnamed protein product [Effrenium voratum]|uniref:Uncharacterized protein n=1 Tax=Effrenium voratum TaxID=2562239 RepID=A0AA36N3J0_9DINO|nr:unnamed protein product [Effrenium voratum]